MDDRKLTEEELAKMPLHELERRMLQILWRQRGRLRRMIGFYEQELAERRQQLAEVEAQLQAQLPGGAA